MASPAEEELAFSWFGEPWESAVCDTTPHVATPVGTKCAGCPRPIEEGDSGVFVPRLIGLAPETIDGKAVAPGSWIATRDAFHAGCWTGMVFRLTG